VTSFTGCSIALWVLLKYSRIQLQQVSVVCIQLVLLAVVYTQYITLATKMGCEFVYGHMGETVTATSSESRTVSRV
jgi:hypothetical protein